MNPHRTETPFLTAEWRDLLMLNFAVEPALLAPYVPTGTALDTHEGSAYLSLVAFQFRDTRVRGLRIPLHHTFEEINLRFYVRRTLPGEIRRAVVFIREFVPRRAIAALARVLYDEPYHALPMRHDVQGSPPRVEYSWRQDGRWYRLVAQTTGDATVPPSESQEAFITEHYWGYTRQRDGGTLEYRVTHPRWSVRNATLLELPALELAYGATLGAAMREPASVLVATGSPVQVYRGTRLPSALPR